MASLAIDRLGLSLSDGLLDLTGTGVLVGLIDTGIDGSQPRLADALVRGYIHGGRGLADGDTGRVVEHSEASLIEDQLGHGTAIASIAVGRGAPASIAPEAGLLVFAFDGSHIGIIQGLNWMSAVADEFALPLVVNLSMGGNHDDGHDGFDVVSRQVDEFSGPGRIVCAAAGNEAGQLLHSRVEILPGDRCSVPFTTMKQQDLADFGVDEVILSRETAKVSGYSDLWNGFSVRVSSPLDPLGGVLCDPHEDAVGQVLGQRVVITSNTHHESGVFNFSVEFDVASHLNWPFTIEILSADYSPPQTVDLYSRDYRGIFRWAAIDGSQASDFEGVSRERMLAGPASARSAICVGAVRDREETGLLPFGLALPCDFSNQGPTRDGRLKPEVALSGEGLWAGLAADHGTGVIGPLTGTSYSTPLVTGIVARLLEHDPTYTPEEVQNMFKSSAVLPTGKGGEFDPARGWGEISADMLAAKLVRRVTT